MKKTIAIGAALLLAPAMAARAADETANRGAPITLGEITVTAQKREENVQKTPVSVDVISGEQLEEAGVENTVDLVRHLPNVAVKDVGSYQQTTIRGVGNFVNALYSPTAMYIDDINMPIVYMQNQELFDLERVEVLKGPQGALYGRNSEAGVINIVTRRPDNERRAKIFGQVSAFDAHDDLAPGYQMGANVSGPIREDALYFGLAGKWQYDQGPILDMNGDDDEALKVNRFFGRGQLRWTPGERLDVTFLADGATSDENFGYGRYLDGMYGTERHRINRSGDDTRDWNSNTQSLRVKYAGNAADFLSVTGRLAFSDESDRDADMAPWPNMMGMNMGAAMNENVHLWSQEFRLSSSEKSESPFSWLVGAYGFSEHIGVMAGYKTTMAMQGMSMYNEDFRYTKIESEGLALFGQGTYTLMDRLRLTAGLRYDHTSQDGVKTHTMDGVFVSEAFKKTLTGDELLPKFSAAYDVTDDVMAYATVSRGFLTGGFDYTLSNDQPHLYYEPEYTWNYEAGVKTTWLDKRLAVNLAAFYIAMDDKQVSEVADALNNLKISNAAEANARGFEIEVQARPVAGLTLNAGLGYTKTEITDWFDALAGIDYDGRELTNTPRYTYNIGAMYQHASGFYGRVDLLGTGKFYHDAQNNLEEPAYELVNLRLGYNTGSLDVALWCKNLFDADYQTVRAPMAMFGATTMAFDGDPRQIGLTVSYTF